jgi:hypothetical protein
MSLTITNLHSVNQTALERFFARCGELGYENNVSHDSIKTEFVQERQGNIWFLQLDSEIISMAGCHRFDEIDPGSFRILYRGCNLPSTDPFTGLSSAHFNSACYRELLPLQLNWIQQQGFDINRTFVTVNRDNPNHRSMRLLERKHILTYYGERYVFYTNQSVWRFNPDAYYAARERVSTHVV